MLLPETFRVHDRERFDFAYGYFLPLKNQVVPDLESLGTQVYCFEASRAYEIIFKAKVVASHAKLIQADVIHAHLPIAGITARIAGRISGIPVVYTEHNLQERYHTLTRLANVYTLPWCARVLCVSEDVTQSVLRNIKRPAKTTTLLNGVNTERFDPFLFNRMEVRQRLNISADAPVMGTVAVFREQKRLSDWLRLAHAVWKELPNAHFFILGDGPQEATLKSKAFSLGMKDCVHFPGRLTEIRPWLAAMDVYTLTSHFEGLPVAMLEAMSMKLPICATMAGGIPEVVRENTEGFMVPLGSTEDLFRPIVKLLQDNELRFKMGKNARQRVIEQFSIERMARELEGVYESVYQEHQQRKNKSL